MNSNIKVASAQLSHIFLNKEKKVQKACEVIIDAGQKGVDLIVLSFKLNNPDKNQP